MRIRVGLAPLFLALAPVAVLADNTFPDATVQKAKAMWQKNAASGGSDHMDCITTLNAAIRILFNEPGATYGSQIDHTMNGLAGRGKASAARVIEFLNEKGKPTTGVTAPDKLQESAFEVAKGMIGGDRGFSVFGLSLMDGYHSVALVFDTSDPANTKVYWCDQWSSNGGWKEHTKESLDANIENLTGNWWSDSKKPRSRTTLWRMKGPGNGVTPPPAQGAVVKLKATVSAANLREAPVNGTVRGTLGPLDRLALVKSENGWHQVKKGSQLLWVSGSLTDVVQQGGITAHLIPGATPGQ